MWAEEGTAGRPRGQDSGEAGAVVLQQQAARPRLVITASGPLCVCVCFNSELLRGFRNARLMEAEEKLSVFPFQAKPAHSFWTGKTTLPSPRSGGTTEWERRFGCHETRVQVLLPSFGHSFTHQREHQFCPWRVLCTPSRQEKQPFLCCSQAGMGANQTYSYGIQSHLRSRSCGYRR